MEASVNVDDVGDWVGNVNVNVDVDADDVVGLCLSKEYRSQVSGRAKTKIKLAKRSTASNTPLLPIPTRPHSGRLAVN